MNSLFTYDNFVHALAGSIASGTAMTVFYPLDTVRSRLQLEDKRKAKNTLATMYDLVQEEGVRAAGEKTALKDLAIGAVAGAINVLTTTPMWVVNTRIKMQGSRSLLAQKSEDAESSDGATRGSQPVTYDCITDGLVKIIKQEGPAALWSGTIPSLVLVTNPAVQFMIFELLKRNLQQILDKKQLSPFHIFALGAASKSVSTLLSYPLQVVQSKKRYGSADVKNKSMTEILEDLVKTGTLYKGMEAKLMQTVMTTALMYVFYERIYSFVTRISKSI